MKNSKKYLKHWLWLLYCHNAVFELRCCYHPVHPGHVAKRKKNTDQNNIIFFRLPTWPHWNTTNHGNIFSSKIHGSLTTPRPWQCEDLQGFGRIIARSRLFPDNYKKAISSGGVAKKKILLLSRSSFRRYLRRSSGSTSSFFDNVCLVCSITTSTQVVVEGVFW